MVLAAALRDILEAVVPAGATTLLLAMLRLLLPCCPTRPAAENKRPEDGSALPPAFLPVLTEDLFSQRFVKLHVPGERRGHAAKGRSKQRARAVRSGSEAGGGEEAAAGDEATSHPMVDGASGVCVIDQQLAGRRTSCCTAVLSYVTVV